MKTKIILICFSLFVFSSECFSQDYVKKNGEKETLCTIKKIDKEKVYYVNSKGEKYFNYLKDISECSIKGAIVRFNPNLPKFKSDFFIGINNDTVYCDEILKFDNKMIYYSFTYKGTRFENERLLEEVKSVYFFSTISKNTDISNNSDTLNNSSDSLNINSQCYNSQLKNSQVLYSAGSELKIASNHYYSGFGVTIIGGIMIGAGAVLLLPELTIVGGVISLLGTLYTLESISHIGNAGKILMGIPKQ